jgi:nucleotide-binding universal stress UspA family protein
MQLLASPFLPTYPYPPTPKVASNAVLVARHLGATLDVAVINIDNPDVASAFSRHLFDFPQGMGVIEAASQSRGRILLETAASEAARHNVTLTKQEVKAHPALIGEPAAAEGRYFDLCMVGCASDDEDARWTAEAIVFNSGRPTLVLPDTRDADSLERVVIAWDGSRVAARAVADATPFLQRAAAVSIVTVTDEKALPRPDIGERLALGLRARGLLAKYEPIWAGDRAIGRALQEHALKIGDGLLVMGGWGHSRLRDFVLGGATEDILSNLRLPVLMSH